MYNEYKRREKWWGISWLYDIEDKDQYFTMNQHSIELHHVP